MAPILTKHPMDMSHTPPYMSSSGFLVLGRQNDKLRGAAGGGTEPNSARMTLDDHILILIALAYISVPHLAQASKMAEDKPCTLTLPDGMHYDLNSLASGSADYEAQVGETSYKLNVCRNVVSEVWTKEDADKVAGFVTRPSGDFSLGYVTPFLSITSRLFPREVELMEVQTS